MTSPLVSIIVPSYNQAHFIVETIESTLQQEYEPLEIWVVDGGSTDGTVDILESYNGRIHYISEPDKGQGDALNKGFALVKGEIVGWLNSDDVYWGKTAVSQIVHTFQQHPSADIVYGDAAIISADSNLLRLRFVPDFDSQRIVRRNTIPQPALFFRKNVIQSEQIDISKIALDYEYWLRLNFKNHQFHHLRTLIAADRNHLQRVSVAQKEAMWQGVNAFRQQYAVGVENGRFPHMTDRTHEAICRLRGFAHLLRLRLQPNWQQQLAFPVKIDSFTKLLYRQLFKAVSDVF